MEITRLKRLLTFSTLASLALIAAGCGAPAPRVQTVVRQVPTNVPKQVLAFYYPWYGNPQVTGGWVHWEGVDTLHQTIGNATHYPELGPYDSHDPQLISQHMQWAAQAGITGFIVSWWGQGTFEDQAVPLLLNAAQPSGLRITVYFEVVPGAATASNALTDVLYLLQHYGSHPAWLKVDGKPVLFVYSRAVGQIGLNGWQQVIDQTYRSYTGGAYFIGDQLSAEAAQVFDGIHTYNPTGQTADKTVEQIRSFAQSAYPYWVSLAGSRISCVTIIPGYDDRKLGRPDPRPTTDRWNGDTYRALWDVALAANPKWILITSWNEWHEGSEIELSVENGHRELETTAQYTPRFHN
jgi:hypothetical protein